MEDSEGMLKKLTGKKNIVFTRRGNVSILAGLKLAKQLGFEDVLLQDQGGWITYPRFVKRLKLNLVELKTDYGLVDADVLKAYRNAVLLVNSMAGYFALQDMKKISRVCRKNKIFLINDVSGSIGTAQARFGDLIIGSFGRWKPLNLHDGGFVAVDEHVDFFKGYSYKLDFKALYGKLSILDYKLNSFNIIHKKIKKELSGFDIVHRDKHGINVVVRFSGESEKKKLIKYCETHNYEHVICPKPFRVLEDAVSIEVKRLDN